MASKRAAVAALALAGALGLAAAQNAVAPKPLVRKDLLVLGTGAPPPVTRDIFRPKAMAVAPAVRRPAGPVTAAQPVPAAEAAPTYTLSVSYLGSIKAAGGQAIGLVLLGGKTLDVAVGDIVAPGYKVVGITSEAIVIEGPNGERKTFTKQGDRP